LRVAASDRYNSCNCVTSRVDGAVCLTCLCMYVMYVDISAGAVSMLPIAAWLLLIIWPC